MEIKVTYELSSLYLKNKFRMRYGLGEYEFRPIAVKLMDMNWSWPPLRRGFTRSMESGWK